MLEKLLLIGIGYVLGTKAGQQGFDDLVHMAKKLAERDEIQMGLGVVKGLVEDRVASVARLAA